MVLVPVRPSAATNLSTVDALGWPPLRGNLCHERRYQSVLAALGLLWALVAYGKYCVSRNTAWSGFSFERGVALVYRCSPDSGIKRAFVFLWPWKEFELEKVDSGA